jgi:hypothetical protein
MFAVIKLADVGVVFIVYVFIPSLGCGFHADEVVSLLEGFGGY